MKIYRFIEPRPTAFWRATRRNTWNRKPACVACGSPQSERIEPFVFKLSHAGRVGHFLWADWLDPAIDTTTFALLDAQLRGLQARSVQLQAKIRLERLIPPGVSFVELTCDTVSCERDRSSLELERACSTCGTERWHIHGVEKWTFQIDGTYEHSERFPHGGICVTAQQLDGRDFFSVPELPVHHLCTERAKRFIEASGMTNIAFAAYGEVVA